MYRADQLRESEARLRTLFEAIEDAVLVHDLKGAVLDCNSAACRRLGYEREELLALRIADIETPEYAAGFAQRCVRQMATGVYVYQAEHQTKNGRRIPVDINLRVISYQGGPAMVISIRDITERKRVEEELELMREAADAAKSEFEAFGREKFDSALFDIQMPEMSGPEATAAIRASEREQEGRSCVPSRMPVIAITANAMKGDRERCIAAGMDGYIAKPINQGELFEMVENMSIIQVPAPRVQFDGALFDGDPAFLAEIVNLFLETCPRLLSAVDDGVLRKDAAALSRAAHTLKGAVSNFGAESVVEQAKTLEIMGKNGDLSGADEACQSLHALMRALLPELEAALGKATEKQAT